MENTSILATIATPFAYLLVPVVGIAAWQLAAAAITLLLKMRVGLNMQFQKRLITKLGNIWIKQKRAFVDEQTGNEAILFKKQYDRKESDS